jgi:hypothetical protein
MVIIVFSAVYLFSLNTASECRLEKLTLYERKVKEIRSMQIRNILFTKLCDKGYNLHILPAINVDKA